MADQDRNLTSEELEAVEKLYYHQIIIQDGVAQIYANLQRSKRSAYELFRYMNTTDNQRLKQELATLFFELEATCLKYKEVLDRNS